MNACRPLVNGQDSFNVHVNEAVFLKYKLNKNDDFKAFVDVGLLATKDGKPLLISDSPLTSTISTVVNRWDILVNNSNIQPVNTVGQK